jgi:hypothetical protein
MTRAAVRFIPHSAEDFGAAVAQALDDLAELRGPERVAYLALPPGLLLIVPPAYARQPRTSAATAIHVAEQIRRHEAQQASAPAPPGGWTAFTEVLPRALGMLTGSEAGQFKLVAKHVVDYCKGTMGLQQLLDQVLSVAASHREAPHHTDNCVVDPLLAAVVEAVKEEIARVSPPPN